MRARFDILVDGTSVATASLDSRRGAVFYDVTYPLPPSLTARKTRVIVEFRARHGTLPAAFLASEC